jgi:hypothetical protein
VGVFDREVERKHDYPSFPGKGSQQSRKTNLAGGGGLPKSGVPSGKLT